MTNTATPFYENDPYLAQYREVILRRQAFAWRREKDLCQGRSLADFATGHLYYGLHRVHGGWVFREWAPNATEIFLVGDFSDWKIDPKYSLTRQAEGNWEILLHSADLHHGQKYKLFIRWAGGEAWRLPSHGNRMVQNSQTKDFDAEIWAPPKPYQWKNPEFVPPFKHPLIYEAHVGMSSQEGKVASFDEFRQNILPRIKRAGYNTVQLMAIQEHPYYGSFGYHVSNFFAVSSRFGTPDDLKHLIDAAHGLGIAVIMDLIHSHAVRNETEGLGLFDGSPHQYFHTGPRRVHAAWDSLCFNYARPEVVHFLLSNCGYWLDEFRFDGLRFDGVTSMLYQDHGLAKNFTEYSMYYDGSQDEDAMVYLILANKLIHEKHPRAVTIAEEMSGMPGLATPLEEGGYGFDLRLAMGIPDYWIRILKELPDEQWDMEAIYRELTSRRLDESTLSYAESHDQALVGDKTIFFRLTDKEIYFNMNKGGESLLIERGIALHKLIRLVTITTAGAGYLNFMGNEFGHPEWIDFPRANNGWSYQHARRQWSLADDTALKYHWLLDFDRVMIDFARQGEWFDDEFPRFRFAHHQDQVLAYSRKENLFVFNFNPSRSFTDYGIQVEPGNYRVLFTTDDRGFGGQGRIDKNILYATSGPGAIVLYLPVRTGLVLQRLQPPVRKTKTR